LKATWKVLDFGVSALTNTSGTLTQGAIVGTPAYMAPEQARAEEVDHRCDVYSLGAVLYRSLTGTAPFWGATPARILYEVEYRMPVRPSELVSSLPRALDAVLGIALAKSRDDRFDSALELSEAFSEAVQQRLSPRWVNQAASNLARHPWGAQIHPDRAEKEISPAGTNPTHATVPYQSPNSTKGQFGDDQD
jgi:serine/threonine-protein kinase